MNKKISSLEIGVLSSYLIKSFILINGINALINMSENDSVVSLIIAFPFSFIIIHVLNKNKFDIYKLTFLPRVISIIVKVILSLFVTIFSSYLVYSISLFTKNCILNSSNTLYISLLFILVVMYTSKNGIYTILKSSFICFGILVLLEIISLAFTLPNINSLKLLPLLTTSNESIIKATFLYFVLSTAPLFLLLCIDKNKIDKINKNNKYIKLFFIITNIYIIFNFILVLSTISYKFASIINYPEVFVLSKISLLNFFDRMEVLLSFKFILDIFFTCSLGIYYIKEVIKNITTNKPLSSSINFLLPIVLFILSNFYKFTIKNITILLLVFEITNIILIFLFDYSNNQKHMKTPSQSQNL